MFSLYYTLRCDKPMILSHLSSSKQLLNRFDTRSTTTRSVLVHANKTDRHAYNPRNIQPW